MNEAVEAAKTQGELVSDLEEDVLDSSQIYWETLEVAADGQIKSARFGNGVTSDWNYDALGRATYIKANTDNTELQNMFFQYDALGNLNERRDNVNDITETFSYDNLNRLTQSQLSGQGASLYQLVGQENQSFSYDALGNLTYKSDVGDFIYGKGIDQGAGVHALVSTSGAINADFSYDANGNQISGHDRQVSYSSFNKPVEINKSGALNKFTYGPNRQMTTQYQSVGDKVVETHYIGNLFEQTTKDGVTESVHHLNVAGHTIAVLKTTPNLAVKSTHYLHQDHLNSVVMITDNKGEVVEKNHYDAFGKKRLAIIDPNAQPLAAGFLPITDRSFTGHRYLPAQELIHMKGRVYDPTFGRFISADPHIQSPLNSQSLNRYSYVMNNPLSFTDPSGYFLSGLKKAFKKFRKLIKKIIKKVIARIMKVINIVISMIPIKPIRDFVQKFWQPIALVVVAVYFPTMLTFVQNAFAIFNAAASYAGGGSLTKILANVAISMGIPNMQGLGASINGAINGINTAVSNVMGFLGDVGSAIGGAGLMGVAITSGLTSGVTSKLFGGSFSKGFKAGFKSAVVNAAFKRVENGIKEFRANREIRANAMMGVGPLGFNGGIAVSPVAEINASINNETGKHDYRIRGEICKQSSAGCNEAYADLVYSHVNGNDVPFTSNDLGSGKRDLLLGTQPITHSEDVGRRTSINKTRNGHMFDPGKVTHEVHFENGSLYYDVTGTGTGGWPAFNNFVGIVLFAPGVFDVVAEFRF